jgi:hypothetical protein
MSPDDPRHGTPQGRPAHIRAGEPVCDACRDANALYQRRYRKTRALYGDRSVDATGTRRRVQALSVLGWSTTQIAERIGMVQNQLWMTTQQDVVYKSTAARVAEIYEALSMTVPPATTTGERISVSRTRSHALRAGWAPPLAWNNIDDPNEMPDWGGADDDEIDAVVVERLVAGRRIPSTHAEKLEAMRRWLAAGGSERSFCILHGWKTGRYVTHEEGAA